jgi:hypothetical protein
MENEPNKNVDFTIERSVLCYLKNLGDGDIVSAVHPIIIKEYPNTEKVSDPARDIIVLATCLGTLVRQAEDLGIYKKGVCMESVMNTLNRIYVTNAIKYTDTIKDGDTQETKQDDPGPSGGIKGPSF